MARRRTVLEVVAGAALAAALVPVVLGQQACTNHACEGAFTTYFRADGSPGGEMADDDTWESTPLDGDWLPFPAGQQYQFFLPDGRTIKNMTAFLSADPAPANPEADNGGNSSWAQAAGNLAVFRAPTPRVGPQAPFIVVANSTCSAYYVRVVIDFAELGDSADAGADAAPPSDATPTADAPPDSMSDAPTPDGPGSD